MRLIARDATLGSVIEDDRRGRAEVDFARDPSGRTYICRQYVSYPYHICRPLTFAGDPPGMATLYLQSCAGGIFQEDRLVERIAAGPAAAAQVTTQAATIVHGMDRGTASQQVSIDAASDALVEFLPDPFILFPRARFVSEVRVRADEAATVLLSDSFIGHDPQGSGAVFDWYRGTLTVEDRSGATVAQDRFRVTGDALQAGTPGITGAFAAQGSFFVLHRHLPAPAIVEALREAVAGLPGTYAGASALPSDCGAWLRVAAADGAALRSAMSAAWQGVRRLLTGLTPAPRRK
ncbi:MAG TPA: urease accessory protein UreD [Methylomirabilota bacterium]|nr:urease accessory protein UreD [Methylomirabilota bacterium]